MNSAIQENVLCLVCYNSDRGGILRSMVPVNLFDVYYRRLAELAYQFWDTYKKAPGEHTLDLVNTLSERQPKEAAIYKKIYSSMEMTKDGVNAEYVITEVSGFVRHQRLRAGILNAVDNLEQNNLPAAEQSLQEAMKQVQDLFQPGLKLTDKRALQFLSSSHQVSFPTGVKELDIKEFGPNRKELHLFMALPKRGKSWWLVNLGKQALLHHLKVTHITLEMSDERTAQRYIQSFFSVSKRKADLVRQSFRTDDFGNFKAFSKREVPTRPSFQDRDIEKVLTNKIKTSARMLNNLVIKEFPTGAMHVRDLEAYLDMLERVDKFIPDLVLVDYADLLMVDAKNYRHELGKIYKDLRGLAVRRNVALATASQGNRMGEDTRVLSGRHVGEDYSKIATADAVITYNCTAEEKELGLARLYISNGRNDEDNFQVLISQNYTIGQFCLASVRMVPKYWEHVKREIESAGTEDGDDK